jgi:hypothetical protein
MSLKARYSPRPDLEIEIEKGTVKDLFYELAVVAEIFSEPSCGLCNSQAILPIIRKSKDKRGKEFTYYEMKCIKCNARLAYGQANDTENLFPKRKTTDANGKEVYDTKNRGWARWKPDAE